MYHNTLKQLRPYLIVSLIGFLIISSVPGYELETDKKTMKCEVDWECANIKNLDGTWKGYVGYSYEDGTVVNDCRVTPKQTKITVCREDQFLETDECLKVQATAKCNGEFINSSGTKSTCYVEFQKCTPNP